MTVAGRVLSALYRLGLRLLRPGARARYGAEMEQMFDDGWRDLRGGARFRFVVGAFAGLLLHAWRVDPPRAPADRVASAARGPSLGDLGRDVRLAVRSLARRPGFTATITLTLVLGIGVNSSMFSLVNGLLLRPLPYADAGRLVQLSETSPELESMDLSLPDFAVWRAATRVLDGVFAFDDAAFVLRTPAGSELVEGAEVSPDFLDVLGVEPVLGRGLLPVEETPGADGVVVISSGLWAELFGSDPDVLGRTVELSGRSRTVVGVAPPRFHFPEVAELWVPLAFDAGTADPEEYGYDAIGRLRPGQSLEDALREGERIAGMLARSRPDTKQGIGTDVYPLRLADVPAEAALASLLLLVAVTLVLLVACANVGSLMLVRSDERARELSTRRALGASRSHLVRQVLVESLLLAALGSGLALVVVAWSGRVFDVVLPQERPFWLDFPVDGRVLAWTLCAGLTASVVAGLGPALGAGRVERGGVGAGSRVTGRGRTLFVTAQVAVATALVVLGGTAVGALQLIASVDPGVDPEGVLILDVVLPPWEYPTVDDVVRGADAALEAAESVGGVASAALVSTVPFVGSGVEVGLVADGGDTGEARIGVLNGVSTDYFGTLGVEVVHGREISGAESRGGLPVAVVSETLARRLWPDGEAIGRLVRHSAAGARTPNVPADAETLRVVGVVTDVRQRGPSRPSRGELYVPWRRLPSAGLTLTARASGPLSPTAETVRARIAEELPGAAFREPATMVDAIGASIWTQRLTSRLMAVMAALGALLAVVGVNGLVAYNTSRRAREIGLRVALGASVGSMRAGVVGRALRLLGSGAVAGLVVGVAAVELARPFVFWLPDRQLVTPFAAAVALVLFGVLASYLPTRRLTALDPMVVLRAE